MASCKDTLSPVELVVVRSLLPDTADDGVPPNGTPPDCANAVVVDRRKVESKSLANFIRMLDTEVKTIQTIETIVALTQQSYERFVYAEIRNG